MMAQMHVNVSVPTPERMEPIAQNAWHPNGGLWTFTDDPKTESFAFWIAQFAAMKHFVMTGRHKMANPRYLVKLHGVVHLRTLHGWLLYPAPSARIATIDSHADLLWLGKRFGWRQCSWKRRVGQDVVASTPGQVFSLDFTALTREFDALHVTDLAIERLETKEAGEYRLAAWEAESTCWFRWCFERVDAIGPVFDYFHSDPGDVFLVLSRRVRTCKSGNFGAWANIWNA